MKINYNLINILSALCLNSVNFVNNVNLRFACTLCDFSWDFLVNISACSGKLHKTFYSMFINFPYRSYFSDTL